MTSPIISIIIPIFNQNQYITDLLSNLCSQQNLEQFEIIFLDNASQQGEYLTIQEYQSRYTNILLQRFSQSQDLEALIEYGIQNAQGEYISILFPDYRFHVQAYDFMAKTLKEKNLDLIYTDIGVTLSAGHYTVESADMIGYYVQKELNALPMFSLWHKEIYKKLFNNDYYHIKSLRIDQVLSLQIVKEHPKADETPNYFENTNRQFKIQDNKKQFLPLEKRPLISAIICIQTQDDIQNLPQLIGNLASQTYPLWEAVIVNASTETSSLQPLIHEINPQNRYQISLLESHLDTPNSAEIKNMGLRLAKGQVILHMKNGTYFRNNHLDHVIQYLQSSVVGFVYAPYNIKNSMQTIQCTEFTKDNLYSDWAIPLDSIAYRREIIKDYGVFKTNYKYFDEWRFVLSLVDKVKTSVLMQDIVTVENPKIFEEILIKEENNKLIDEYIIELNTLFQEFIEKDKQQIIQKREAYINRLNKLKVDENYIQWVAKREFREVDAEIYAEHINTFWKKHPYFHMVTSVVQRDEFELLKKSIETANNQLYKNWILTVISPFDPFNTENIQFNQKNGKLIWKKVGFNESYSDVLNQAIQAISSDWFGIFEPGFRLHEKGFGLLKIADYSNFKPDWTIIYTDEDKIRWSDKYKKEFRCEHQFKPDFSLDYLRSMSYIGNAVFFKNSILKSVTDSFKFTGAINYHLALSYLDASKAKENSVGHISDQLMSFPVKTSRPFSEAEGLKVLELHLERNQLRANVSKGYADNTYFVNYQHDETPLVSIIIPTKDKLAFLQDCIESLVKRTTYQNYELIVVDNNSTDPDVFNYYKDLEKRLSSQVKILEYKDEFNFSAICNYGVEHSKGEYVLLLNNDTTIIQDQWLERMMNVGMRKDVGVVGCRLVYPEVAKIQHAGVFFGAGYNGTADHIFIRLPISEHGYMNRACVTQNYNAVTAACMLVRKSIYEEVKGFDTEYKVEFNDVDFCIRVGKNNYNIVYTPFVTLVHHESITRSNNSSDANLIAKKEAQSNLEKKRLHNAYGNLLKRDSFFNQNLKVGILTQPEVDDFIVANWDTNFNDRPRIGAIPLAGGCGEYRVRQPFNKIVETGIAQCEYYQKSVHRVLNPIELYRLGVDSFMVHAAISPSQIEMLEKWNQFAPDIFKLFALDDLVTAVPEKSSAFRTFSKQFKEAQSQLRKSVGQCNRAIVSTQPLADLLNGMTDDIWVVPNTLDGNKWLLETKHQISDKPRVGWVGAQQHQGDLELIIDLVKQTAHEVDWIFMGMTIPEIKPYIKEEYAFVAYEEYPKRMASLNLDIAIAPLEVNAFNEAKSNLRLLEYGIMGWSVICTDVYPYQNAPVKRVKNNPQEWLEALRERIYDRDMVKKEGEILRKWVLDNFMLEDRVVQWFESCFSPAKFKEWTQILKRNPHKVDYFNRYEQFKKRQEKNGLLYGKVK